MKVGNRRFKKNAVIGFICIGRRSITATPSPNEQTMVINEMQIYTVDEAIAKIDFAE